jgi:hypothetical protein
MSQPWRAKLAWPDSPAGKSCWPWRRIFREGLGRTQKIGHAQAVGPDGIMYKAIAGSVIGVGADVREATRESTRKAGLPREEGFGQAWAEWDAGQLVAGQLAAGDGIGAQFNRWPTFAADAAVLRQLTSAGALAMLPA